MPTYKKVLGVLTVLMVLTFMVQQVRATHLLWETRGKFIKVAEGCRLDQYYGYDYDDNGYYGPRWSIHCPGMREVLDERDQLLQNHHLGMMGEWRVSLPYVDSPETSTLAVYY